MSPAKLDPARELAALVGPRLDVRAGWPHQTDSVQASVGGRPHRDLDAETVRCAALDAGHVEPSPAVAAEAAALLRAAVTGPVSS